MLSFFEQKVIVTWKITLLLKWLWLDNFKKLKTVNGVMGFVATNLNLLNWNKRVTILPTGTGIWFHQQVLVSVLMLWIMAVLVSDKRGEPSGIYLPILAIIFTHCNCKRNSNCNVNDYYSFGKFFGNILLIFSLNCLVSLPSWSSWSASMRWRVIEAINTIFTTQDWTPDLLFRRPDFVECWSGQYILQPMALRNR